MCAAEWRSTRQTAADSFRNAGGNVVDQEVVTDQNITSSRWPDDLPAFCARIVEQFAAPGSGHRP